MVLASGLPLASIMGVIDMHAFVDRSLRYQVNLGRSQLACNMQHISLQVM
jgi:hypothetical protein